MSTNKSNFFTDIISEIEKDYNSDINGPVEGNYKSRYLRVISSNNNRELFKTIIKLDTDIVHHLRDYGIRVTTGITQSLINLGYWKSSNGYEFVLEQNIIPSNTLGESKVYFIITNRRRNKLIDCYRIDSSLNVDMSVINILNTIDYICTGNEVVNQLLVNRVFNYKYFSIMLISEEDYNTIVPYLDRVEIPGYIRIKVREKINSGRSISEYVIPLNLDLFVIATGYLRELDIELTKDNFIYLVKNGLFNTDRHVLSFSIIDYGTYNNIRNIVKEINNPTSNTNYDAEEFNNLYDFLANKDIRQLSRIYTAIAFDNDSSDKTDLIKEVKSLVDDGIIDRPYGGLVNGIKETIAMIMAEYIGG